MVAVASVLAANLLYYNWYIIGQEEGRIVFTVTYSTHFGFAADLDKLNFGRLQPGGLSNRGGTLSSKIPARAYIRVNPELEGIVVPDHAVVDLQPGNATRVKFTLTVPESMPEGNYTGSYHITYVRLLPWQR